MKDSPTKQGERENTSEEVVATVDGENINGDELNIKKMEKHPREPDEKQEPAEEKISNLNGPSAAKTKSVEEQDINIIEEEFGRVLSLNDRDNYTTRGPNGGLATDPKHQFQNKANKILPVGPYMLNYMPPQQEMQQFVGKRSFRDDDELQPHKYMNPGVMPVVPPSYTMPQQNPPAYPYNNLNIGVGQMSGVNGVNMFGLNSFDPRPRCNFVPEPVVSEMQLIGSNHCSGGKVTVRSPGVAIPDPFKDEEFNVDKFLASALDQPYTPTNQISQPNFSKNNMTVTAANIPIQLAEEDFTGQSYRKRRTSDPSDSGIESAEERSPYSDSSEQALSPTGSTYTSPRSVDSGCEKSPNHDPFSSCNQLSHAGSPPHYQGVAMSPAALRPTQSPATGSGYGSDGSGSQYIDTHTDDLQMALSVIANDMKQDDMKKKKSIVNADSQNITNPQTQPSPPVPTATATTPIPQPLMPARSVGNQVFMQQPQPTTMANQMLPPSTQKQIIILPPQTQPMTLLVPVNPVFVKNTQNRNGKPKPRPILPKVPGSVGNGAQNANTSTTPSQKQGVAMMTKVVNPPGSYINRNVTNLNQQVSGQQQQHNKLLMIARRTVADIPADALQQSDEEGDTYLHIAVCKTDRHMVQALLERCKRQDLLSLIDRENKARQTPLYLAVAINQPPMVQMFIKFRANVNTLAQNTSSDGQMTEVKAAIHVATSKGRDFLTTLQELLKAVDISINIVNNLGQTALHCAVMNHGKVRGDRPIDSIPIVQTLLKAGADPGAQDKRSGKTPLMYAIEQHSLIMVQTILSAVDRMKVRNVVQTQAFNGSSCLRIAEGLRGEYDQQTWNQLYNSLQNAISGNVSPRLQSLPVY